MENIIIAFILLVIGLGIFIIGWISANKINHAKMHSAENYAKKITLDAKREAENQKRAAVLEAKDEWYRERTKFEKETRERRKEIEESERVMNDRERKLDKKVDISTLSLNLIEPRKCPQFFGNFIGNILGAIGYFDLFPSTHLCSCNLEWSSCSKPPLT